MAKNKIEKKIDMVKVRARHYSYPQPTWSLLDLETARRNAKLKKGEDKLKSGDVLQSLIHEHCQ